jgi:exosortase/archaeosortase family protein
VLGFIALYAGFTVLWQALADTPLLHAWIEQIVVPAAAAWLAAGASLAGSGSVFVAEGARLVGTASSLNVLPGCEGSDAMLLVAAAVLVAPRSGGQRLLGLLVVLGLVFALNQVRLAGLLWALAHDRALFDRLHTLWLPLALVLASVGVFWAWLHASAPRSELTP